MSVIKYCRQSISHETDDDSQTTFSKPAKPLAPSRWPMFDLTEPLSVSRVSKTVSLNLKYLTNITNWKGAKIQSLTCIAALSETGIFEILSL